MLQPTYRFAIKNATGVALGGGDSVTITAKRWNFNSSGGYTTESSEATVFSGGASLANNTYATGTTQNNVIDKWLGGEFLVTAVVSTATPNGSIEIWLQYSTDGGTTWNDNSLGQFVTAINFTATGTKKQGFEL